MSRQNFFHFTFSLLNVLIKQDMGNTKKLSHYMGGKLQNNKSGYTLAELWPRPREGSNKQFHLCFLKIPDLVQRPTAAMGASENHR